MPLWLVFGLMIAAAAVIIVVLLLRRGGDPAAETSGLDAYKNELAEIERKKSAGLADEKDADTARSDIEKRILAAVLERAPARPAGTRLNYAVISAAERSS